MSPLKKIITSLILTTMVFSVSPAMALTFTEVVNLLQAPDINLPTGITNPKGNIGFILANLFWGTADGTKNGKIKPQYLDYSGISSWTQSGTITYLTASTGSVGIGTPNPGEYSAAIRGMDDTATKGALWISGQTATTPGLMVRNDGNVGIGTASPGRTLHIWSPINTVGARVTVNVSGGIGSPYTPLEIEARNDVDMIDGFGPRINFYASDNTTSLQSLGAIGIVRSGADNTGDIVFRPSKIGTENERMRIGATGNIGIGTASPLVNLHIQSGGASTATRIMVDNYSNTAGYPPMLRFRQSNSNTPGTLATTVNDQYLNETDYHGVDSTASSFRQAAGIDVLQDGAAGATWVPGRFQFFTTRASDGVGATRMTIKNDGNVGIGTTAPATKLEVTGNIRNAIPTAYGYLELSGDLPGYAVNTYPTLKTNGANLFFSAGGVYSAYMTTGGTWTVVSDKNKKENITQLDYIKILNKIDQLPITQWNYKAEDISIRHIGPFAQDFHRLFDLNGPNDKMISTTDPAGVALAGIKGLSEKSKM